MFAAIQYISVQPNEKTSTCNVSQYPQAFQTRKDKPFFWIYMYCQKYWEDFTP